MKQEECSRTSGAANVDRLGAMVRDETARDELQADDSEVSRLRAECRRLQMQVDAQGWELNLLRARFGRYETALRGSHVTVSRTGVCNSFRPACIAATRFA